MFCIFFNTYLARYLYKSLSIDINQFNCLGVLSNFKEGSLNSAVAAIVLYHYSEGLEKFRFKFWEHMSPEGKKNCTI